MEEGKKCCCPCHKFGAIVVILIGLGFLLRHLDVIGEHSLNLIWPTLVILAGLKWLFAGMCKCCSQASCEKK